MGFEFMQSRPTSPRLRAESLLLTALLVAPAAGAQPAEPSPTSPSARQRLISTLSSWFEAGEPRPWTFALEPAMWYVAADGDIKLPGSAISGNGQQIQLGLLNLDSPRVSPFIEVHGVSDGWRATLSGYALETTGRESLAEFSGQLGPVGIGVGDSIRANFELFSLEFTLARTVFEDFTRSGREGLLRADLDVLAGVRVYDVATSIRTPSGRADHEEFFIEPLVGVKLRLHLDPQATIDVQTSFGGFTDGGNKHSFSWDILAGFQWRPIDDVGVQFGYRNIVVDLQSGEGPGTFDYFGALAGLYAGVVVRF
jgi:opacity protein-like surface antigen